MLPVTADEAVAVTVTTVAGDSVAELVLTDKLTVGLLTFNVIEVLPNLNWSSKIVIGKFLEPSVVETDTVALYEKILSPAVTSPLVPLSKKS